MLSCQVIRGLVKKFRIFSCFVYEFMTVRKHPEYEALARYIM